MSDGFDKKKHGAYLENRETLEMSGINDIKAFNEEEITAQSDWGNILIKGSDLHIEALDLETGELKVRGKIGAVVYSDVPAVKGLFGRLFS